MQSMNEEQPPTANRDRRATFRLRLPRQEKLIATIADVEHIVLEISEQSVVVDAAEVPNRNGVCTGVIHWDDEHSSTFQGTLGVPALGGRLIKDVTGITMRDMVRQQRKLIRLYPSVRQRRR